MDYKEAFKPFEPTLDRFTHANGLDTIMWNSDGNSIIVGTNIGLNQTGANSYFGMRREVEINVDVERAAIYCMGAAVKDYSYYAKDRKLKDGFYGAIDINATPSEFESMLREAWMAANLIGEGELLDIYAWKEDCKGG